MLKLLFSPVWINSIPRAAGGVFFIIFYPALAISLQFDDISMQCVNHYVNHIKVKSFHYQYNWKEKGANDQKFRKYAWEHKYQRIFFCGDNSVGIFCVISIYRQNINMPSGSRQEVTFRWHPKQTGNGTVVVRYQNRRKTCDLWKRQWGGYCCYCCLPS